jgi:hypothetical protein
VTIETGILQGFTYGVRFEHSLGRVTENLKLIGPSLGVSFYFTAGTIVRNNQLNGPGSSSGTGIDIEGGNRNLVSQNVISNFAVCAFGEGGNYFAENMVSNAIIDFRPQPQRQIPV